MITGVRWPERFTPGSTDNFSSNEVVALGLNSDDVWSILIDTSEWINYHPNVTNIEFENNDGPKLFDGVKFSFDVFGFNVKIEVVEFSPPGRNQPGRLSWLGVAKDDNADKLEIYHAWILEDIDENRLRVLTQESQIGALAKKLALIRPNPMINVYQDWLEGLVQYTRESLGK